VSLTGVGAAKGLAALGHDAPSFAPVEKFEVEAELALKTKVCVPSAAS